MTPAWSRRLAVGTLAMSLAAQGTDLHAARRPTALPGVPLYRESGAWVVACDNVRRCVVKSLDNAGSNAETHDDATILLVTREPGPDAVPYLLIESDQVPAPSALTLDGRPAETPMPWPRSREGAAFLKGEPAVSLLRRMRDATTLAFSLPDGEARLSLRGLSAALRLTDAVQGRTGTLTALLAPGQAPAANVPPAPAMPTLRAAPPPPALDDDARLLAAARRAPAGTLKGRGCHPDTLEPSWAKPLDAARAIVGLGCFQGPYQGSALMALVPRAAPAEARVLRLPPPPGEPPGDGEDSGDMLSLADWDPRRGILMEPGYDPATATLDAQVLGRALHDCGMTASWVFDGKAFQPSGFSMQRSCGSLNQEWPVLFRTEPASP